MSAERGWIIEPQPQKHSVEAWAERHRRAGHHPQPTPTTENPERWDCECGGLWRILTPEQIRQKFAHLKRELREGEQARTANGEGGARPAHSRSVSPAPAPVYRRSVFSWAPSRQGQR